MPADLPRLPGRPRRSSAETNSATYAALIGLCVLALGFLGIASLVLPQVQGLLLVIFGGIAFFAIHYLLWGRLLTRLRARAPEDERKDS